MTHYTFESVPGAGDSRDLLIFNSPLADLQIRIKLTQGFYSPLYLPEWILPNKLARQYSEQGYSVTYVECRLGDVTYIYGLSAEGVGLQLRMVVPLYRIGGDVNLALIKEFQVWSLLDTPNLVVDRTLEVSRGVSKPYSKQVDQLAIDAFQWVGHRYRLGLDGKRSHYVLRDSVTSDRPTGHLSHDYGLLKLLTDRTVTAKVIHTSDLDLTVYDSKIQCELRGEKGKLIDLQLTDDKLGSLWALDTQLNTRMDDFKARLRLNAVTIFDTCHVSPASVTQCRAMLNEIGLDYTDPTIVTRVKSSPALRSLLESRSWYDTEELDSYLNLHYDINHWEVKENELIVGYGDECFSVIPVDSLPRRALTEPQEPDTGVLEDLLGLSLIDESKYNTLNMFYMENDDQYYLVHCMGSSTYETGFGTLLARGPLGMDYHGDLLNKISGLKSYCILNGNDGDKLQFVFTEVTYIIAVTDESTDLLYPFLTTDWPTELNTALGFDVMNHSRGGLPNMFFIEYAGVNYKVIKEPTMITANITEVRDLRYGVSSTLNDITDIEIKTWQSAVHDIDEKWSDIAELLRSCIASHRTAQLISLEITDDVFKLKFVGQTLELVLVDSPSLLDTLTGFFVKPSEYITQKFEELTDYDLTKKFVCKHPEGFITRINNSYVLVRDATRD